MTIDPTAGMTEAEPAEYYQAHRDDTEPGRGERLPVVQQPWACPPTPARHVDRVGSRRDHGVVEALRFGWLVSPRLACRPGQPSWVVRHTTELQHGDQVTVLAVRGSGRSGGGGIHETGPGLGDLRRLGSRLDSSVRPTRMREASGQPSYWSAPISSAVIPAWPRQADLWRGPVVTIRCAVAVGR